MNVSAPSSLHFTSVLLLVRFILNVKKNYIYIYIGLIFIFENLSSLELILVNTIVIYCDFRTGLVFFAKIISILILVSFRPCLFF
jgi:hypothetical protein